MSSQVLILPTIFNIVAFVMRGGVRIKGCMSHHELGPQSLLGVEISVLMTIEAVVAVVCIIIDSSAINLCPTGWPYCFCRGIASGVSLTIAYLEVHG